MKKEQSSFIKRKKVKIKGEYLCQFEKKNQTNKGVNTTTKLG